MASTMSKAVAVRCALLLFCSVISVNSDNCRIAFKEHPAAHEVIEPLYLIDLSIKNTTHGLATTYFPNTQYDIIIRPKSSTLSFKEFHFKMENANSSKSYGTLELRDTHLTRFDTQDYCINRVVNLAAHSQPNVTIGWQSPPSKSGCINMVAYVKETDIRYHNANLTVCEDPRIELDDPGQIVKNCSVCERAKYEMTFKGVWSKFTHPRSYPTREWEAGFPTVIGATHHRDYQIWEVYKYSSEAMKKFVETGNSLDLELELKNHTFFNETAKIYDNVTTIIKFRGTNVKNKTHAFAQLQVDRRNHLVSLVARINPSPDWFIGVSSLELCTGKSWMENKTLNLYAYDVGSRTGLLYDQENNGYTNDVINHMNMSWPVPPAGSEFVPPFYDPTNNTHEVRPLAVIEFRRIRLFDTTCGVKPDEKKLEQECFTEWHVTKPCNETCGYDIEISERDYKSGKSNATCPGKTVKREPCPALKACPFIASQKECQLTEWSIWDLCQKSCGPEIIGRTRNFKESNHAQDCKDAFKDKHLHEFKDCGHPPCPNLDLGCNDKLYHEWSDWGECSVTVGKGLKYRHRQLKNDTIFSDLTKEGLMDAGYIGCTYDKMVCIGVDPKTITEAPIVNRNDPEIYIIQPTEHSKPDKCFRIISEGEACPGKSEESLNRYGYDQYRHTCKLFKYKGCGGNDNQFDEEKDCYRVCYDGEKIDCVMEWEQWTTCCHRKKTRRRVVKIHPSPNGKACPVSGNYESKLCSDPTECVWKI